MADHFMQPTSEQFKEWLAEACRLHPTGRPDILASHVARLAYAAGADAELEACCEWVDTPVDFEDYRPGKESKHLRATRRPKPPAQKQEAINALNLIMSRQKGMFDGKPFDTILTALEALPDSAPSRLTAEDNFGETKYGARIRAIEAQPEETP